MESEYAKHLEDENTALRMAMNRMEDEIKRLSKELENTALTKDDCTSRPWIPTTRSQFSCLG